MCHKTKSNQTKPIFPFTHPFPIFDRRILNSNEDYSIQIIIIYSLEVFTSALADALSLEPKWQ